MFAIRKNMDDALIHLKETGFYPDLIIDVGAADGTPPLQNCFSESRFFWIEPLKEFEPALINLQQKLKGDYAMTAVGRDEGSFVLNIHKDLHGSTMFKETDGEAADGVPREIPVTTLNKLGLANNWSQFSKILLKADVQGFELEVLEGAKEILPYVDVIILEVSFFRFLKNAPDFYDVVTYMKNIGYVVYDIVSGINRPLDYALGQKDLVFVKENGIFRQSHGWAK
jgi:FkbM family methyltransferase